MCIQRVAPASRETGARQLGPLILHYNRDHFLSILRVYSGT